MSLKAFTVIGIYEDSKQVFSHYVMAEDGNDAIQCITLNYVTADVVAAIPGHLEEGTEINFAMNAAMDFPDPNAVAGEQPPAKTEYMNFGSASQRR